MFTSLGDNISPPPQALGWVVDCYSDVQNIQATGQTIVYCMSQKIGHLALFVSSKVGAEQGEAFVQLMEVIDCLPPGLYEMVVSPRPSDVPAAGFITGNWIAGFEPRTLNDIRALGRNGPADDRAFAAVEKLDIAHTLNPLRLSYTIFADSNPWMRGVQSLAALASASRKPVGADNPLLVGGLRRQGCERWLR